MTGPIEGPDTFDWDSPERKAADDALLDAISARLRLSGQLGPDEVVQSFVIAAHLDGFGLRERNASSYGYLTRDSGIGPQAAPVHELQGLAIRLTTWLAQEDA